MGKQNLADKKAIIPNISDAAYIPKDYSSKPNYNNNGTPKSINDLWDPDGQGSPSYKQNIGLDEFYTGGRYTATIPGTDYEDIHGAQQSGLDQAFNGLMKGVNLTATTIAGGFGTVYGLGKSMVSGKLSDIWDNEIMQSLDEWNTKVDQEYLPNYYTNKQTDARWYETDNWLTTNFLFDKVIKNSGFAVGAMISGNIANSAFLRIGSNIGKWASTVQTTREAKNAFGAYTNILRNTSRAFSQGKNIEAATILEKQILGIADVTARGKSLKDLANVTNKFSKYSDGARRTAVAAYSSAGEANFEALQTSNEYRNNLISEYVNIHGEDPQGENLKEINARSAEIGATSFVGNLALLGVTEWFQLPYLLGSSYKSSRKLHSSLIRNAGETVKDASGKLIAAAPKTRFGRIFKKATRVGAYVADPKEGAQEIGQYALQVGAENYYNKAYEGNSADAWIDGVIYGFVGKDEEGEGVGALVSKEGIEGGLIGALTGGAMQGIGRYKSNQAEASATNDFISSLENAPTFKEAFKQKLKAANRGTVLQEMREDGVKEGNLLEVKDLDHDLMFNYIYNKIKYGRKDLIKEDLDELRLIASTDEGLSQLIEQGLANKGDTIRSYGKRLSEIITYVDTLELMTENVNLVYGSQTTKNPEGENVSLYSESALEKLAYVSSKIADYDLRIPMLEANIGSALLNTTNILENINDKEKLENSWLEEEIKLEETKLVSPADKPAISKSLEDFVELHKRKNYFIKEYADIVSNPIDYSEEGKELKRKLDPKDLATDDLATDDPEDSNKVNIKTKKRPKGWDYTIGEEYTLGNVFGKDSKNNKIFRFPTLTILGENEDGTIKIKDNKGVIRDVSKDVFEDYNLGLTSKIAENPDANFVKRNINKVVFWNTGKKKSGEVPGRIKWDSVNDNIVFVYKKGEKNYEKVINVDAFEPKKGFKLGIFHFGKELSNLDNKDVSKSNTTGRTAEKIKQRQSDRLGILTDLYLQMTDQQEKTDKLIESKKTQIESINKKLEEQKKEVLKQSSTDKRAKKFIKYKKTTISTLQSIRQLSKTVEQLENEIVVLKEQTIEIEDTLAYINTLADTLDQTADDTEQFMFDLKFEQALLSEGAEQTVLQINVIQNLIKSTKVLLADSYDLISSLIKTFQRTFPDVPTLMPNDFIAYLKEQRSKLLIEDIENPYIYKEARVSLEELNENIQFIEESEIPFTTDRLVKMQEDLSIMMEDLANLEAQSRSMQPVIDKFQKVYDDFLFQKNEKEAFMMNTDMHEEIIGTHSNDAPFNPNTDGYEADAKKTEEAVAGSTTVSTDFDEDHHLRAERFGFNFDKFTNKRKIKAVNITQANQDKLIPGLIEHVLKVAKDKGKSFDPTKAIFAVFVTETKAGDLRLVGENGKPLSKKQKEDAVNNAIYQPFPEEDLTIYSRSLDKMDTMFRKTVPLPRRNEIKAKYKVWRDGILKVKEEGKTISNTNIGEARRMRPSMGMPVYVQKFIEGDKDKAGIWVDDRNAKTSVFEAELITDDDLESQVLQVATTNTAVTNNGVTFKTPLGRVFLNTERGLTPVKSRKLNKKESSNIFAVLQQVAKGVATKKTLDSDTKDLFKWLRSIVQWGKPITLDKDGNEVAKKPGYSNVWFDYVLDENGKDKEPRLFISGLGFSIPFTPSYLEKNKTDIIKTLQELYHNVQAGPVNNDYSTPYNEITGIKSDGTPTYRKWERGYQEYLLSSDGRNNNDEIPLTTAIAPIVEDDDINRKGIYFTYNDADEMFSTVVDKEVVEEDTEEEEGDDTPSLSPAGPKPAGVVTNFSPVLDGMTENIYKLPISPVNPDGTAYAKYRATSKEVVRAMMFDWEMLRSRLEEDYGPTGPQDFIDGDLMNSIKTKVIDPFLAKPSGTQTAPSAEEAPAVNPDRAAEVAADLDSENTVSEEDKEDELFRILLNESYNKKENWTTIEKFLKEKFPHVPFYRVKNLITATKNRKALGMFHKGAMYVYEGAEEGTTYHEVFEVVWKMFASPQEKIDIINEFKERNGTFKDRVSQQTIRYSEATDHEIKEQLAEEFRAFKLNGEKPKGSLLARLFKELIDFIKTFFSGENSVANSTALFEKIDSGHYATYNPYGAKIAEINDEQTMTKGFLYIENATGDETSDFRIDLPTRQLNDVMQHMTYTTISKFFKDDDSLVVDANFNKNELYNTLYEEIKSLYSKRLKAQKEILKNAELRNDDVLVNKTKNTISALGQEWLNVKDDWSNIIDKHIETLQTYNITFDENDYALLNDEDNSGKGDYLDSRKIDPFKKASAAIKLMLATIPEINPRNHKKAKRSSIGGFVMMDVGKAFIELMDNLHGAVNLDDMMVKLQLLANKYPNYRLLYQRLLKEKFIPLDKEAVEEGEMFSPPTYKKLTNNTFELLSSFWRTFKKMSPSIITVFHLEGGRVIVTDSSLTSAAASAQYSLRNNLVNAIKKNQADKLFFFDGKTYTAISKQFDKVVLDPNKPETYTKFLNKLGLSFPLGKVDELSNAQFQQFTIATQGLKKVLGGLKDIKTLNNVTLDSEGNLFDLAIIKSIMDNEEFQSTYWNVNGEKAQTFIGTNAISNIYDKFESIQNKSELANSEYDYLSENKHGVTQDPNSEGSVMMSKMFNKKTGKKTAASKGLMKPVFIDGTINQKTNKNLGSSALKYANRIVQELNANLEGIMMNLVPADASIEWGIKMFHKHNPFVSSIDYKQKDYLDIFRKYLVSEIKLVRSNRPTVNPKNSRKLRFFSEMLPSSLQYKVLEEKGSPESVVEKFGNEVDRAVSKFIETEANDTFDLLEEYGLFYKTSKAAEKMADKVGETGEFGRDLSQKDSNTETPKTNVPVEELYETPDINFNGGIPLNLKDFKSKLGEVTVNYVIANIEMHKLIYSDPYQYKDELKRIKSFSSPRQALMHGSNALNSTLNRLYNKGYESIKRGKRDIGWSDFKSGFLKGVTFKDLYSIDDYLGKISPELKEYLEPWEKTDGGGLITIKGKRKMALNAGMWSPNQEKQYRYDIAYEKAVKNLEMSEEEKDLYMAGNPGVQELYTPMKPIVSGRKVNGRKYNDIVLDKFALFPISFRVIHQMSKKSNMLDVYNKLQNEDVDYGIFGSGRKIGTELEYEMYKDGKINTDPFETKEQKKDNSLPQYVIKIPYSIISIQTEVPTKEEGGTTQGSQITKLATLDMMEAGVPIDFELEVDGGRREATMSERYNAWLNIKTEEERIIASPLYKELKNNQSILEARAEFGYKKMLLKLGIKEVINGNDISYKIFNRDRLIKTLRDEIFSRSVNSNLSDSFKAFAENDAILEATTSYQQIRNILYSIARKNITRPKISGGYKVQMMSAFFENNDIEVKTVKNSKGEDVEVVVSEMLNNYRDEDGKRVCEIMVSRWFDSPMSDEELLDYMYVLKDGKRTAELTEEGKNIMEGIGFRIPTQKQNSMEVFVIAKFLPKEMKDTVVVPSALVRKTGADFDIDKLSVYLKNVIGGKFPKAVKFFTEENSTPEERYYSWIKELSESDTRGYVSFLTRQETKAITKKYDALKDNAYQNYVKAKSYVSETAQEFYQAQFDYKSEIKSDQDAKMKKIFSEGNKLFWQLEESTLSIYFELKEDLRQDNTKGAPEITEYLTLTEYLKGLKETPNNDKLLMTAMILNYKESLATLGVSEKIIDNISKEVSRIKKDKEFNKEVLLQAVRELNKEIHVQLNEQKERVNLEWAEEVANREETLSFEDFKKLNIYEQNASKNLDNGYISSLFTLGSHKLNFHRLVVPNSADKAKDIVKDLNKKLKKEEIDYTSAGNMLKRRFMSGLRHAFVSGKRGVGVSAIGATNNAQNQRSLIKLEPENFKYLSNYDLNFIQDLNFTFENYNSINGEVTLSLAKNAERSKEFPKGQYISDIIGMFIDGYVDIAKGPWIMELGASFNVAGTWLFLLKAGVPFQDVAYFINQPIIRDYIKTLDKAGMSSMFSTRVLDGINGKYASSSKLEFSTIANASSLGKMVGKELKGENALTADEKAEQVFLLKEFLKYAKMSEHLLTFIQGSNFDTANLNDPVLVFKKTEQLKKAQRSLITSVDDTLKDSSVGTLVKVLKKVRNAFGEVLLSDRQGDYKIDQMGPREIIEEILRPYVSPYLNDKEFVKIGRKAVEHLFDWAMQTGTNLNSYIESSFYDVKGNASTVQQLVDFKKEIKSNPSHDLFSNLIINNLEIISSGREGRIDVIRIKNKENKTFNQDLTISSFREIKEYLKNQDNIKLYDDFVRLGIIQSGLTNSYISFTHLIPYEDFKIHYNTVLSVISSNPNLKNFIKLNELQRSNPSDTKITARYNPGTVRIEDRFNPLKVNYYPKPTYKRNENIEKHVEAGVIPEVIKVSLFDSASEKDVISWSWLDKTLTYAEKQKLRKKGDDSLWKQGLFQKVYEYVDGVKVPLIQESKNWKNPDKPYLDYIYKQINTRGDGIRAKEHYDAVTDRASGEVLGVKSKIQTNYGSVTEVSDKKIVEIFYGENVIPTSQQVKVQVKREGKVVTPSTGINISSYETGLGKSLSNFAKIDITVRGKKYISAEAAYQTLKKSLPELSDDNVTKLMTEILVAKLKQSPSLMKDIVSKGGTLFLKNSSHNLIKNKNTVKKDRWTGHNGLFMKSLRQAFTQANKQGFTEDLFGKKSVSLQGNQKRNPPKRQQLKNAPPNNTEKRQLRDGKYYAPSDINQAMLTAMGYDEVYANKILKQIC